MNKKKTLNFITKTAIFASLSVILYFLKFPLPFVFPAFLEIQFSSLPAILGGFILGPVGGVIIVLIKTLIKLLTSHTFGVGELSDLIIGLSVGLASSFIYKYNKTKKGGVIALAVGCVVWILFSTLSNLFIIMPTYVRIMGKDAVVASLKVINGVTEENFMKYYILYAVLPFNILLSTIVMIVTYFVYKRISKVFKNDFFGSNKDKSVLVICDSFKGSLSSKEVGEVISSALNDKGLKSDFITISDGGEGFLDAVISDKQNLTEFYEYGFDCFFRPNKCRYLYSESEKTAYFELAEVVGLCKIKPEEKSPFAASTYGLGVVIRKAIEKHEIKKIILGIGGSASTDAGAGMLEALGAKFYDANKNLITKLNNEKLGLVEFINLKDINILFKDIEFLTLTDVTNPLLGENGAAYVYGPQKGALTKEIIEGLEANVAKFSKIATSCLGHDYSATPGAGAAGGVGFGTQAFLSAKLVSGIETILKDIHFEKIVKKYDQIITGEGRIDEQSFQGKVASGILSYEPKNLLFVVALSEVANPKYKILSIVPTVATAEESMAHPKEMLKKLIDEAYDINEQFKSTQDWE